MVNSTMGYPGFGTLLMRSRFNAAFREIRGLMRRSNDCRNNVEDGGSVQRSFAATNSSAEGREIRKRGLI